MPATRHKQVAHAALLAACALLALHPATGAGVATRHKPRQYKVEVGSDFYDPPKVTLRVGDRILWDWVAGYESHDVVVDKGPEKFHSPVQTSGAWRRTFRKPGRFDLYCTQHTMFMTVLVKR